MHPYISGSLKVWSRDQTKFQKVTRSNQNNDDSYRPTPIVMSPPSLADHCRCHQHIDETCGMSQDHPVKPVAPPAHLPTCTQTPQPDPLTKPRTGCLQCGHLSCTCSRKQTNQGQGNHNNVGVPPEEGTPRHNSSAQPTARHNQLLYLPPLT